MDKKTRIIEILFDILGEILAILTIVLYAILIINANWSFIPAGKVLDVLLVLKSYAALIVVAIVGFEAMVKFNFVLKVLFLILLAVIVIFQFFPGTWNNIMQIF